MNDALLGVAVENFTAPVRSSFSPEVAKPPTALPVKDFLEASSPKDNLFWRRGNLMEGLTQLSAKETGKIDLSDQKFIDRQKGFFDNPTNKTFIDNMFDKITYASKINNWAFSKPEVGPYKGENRMASYQVIKSFYDFYRQNPDGLASDRLTLVKLCQTMFGEHTGLVTVEMVEQMVKTGNIDINHFRDRIDLFTTLPNLTISATPTPKFEQTTSSPTPSALPSAERTSPPVYKTPTVTPAHPVKVTTSSLPVAGPLTETTTAVLKKQTPEVHIGSVNVSSPPIAEAAPTITRPAVAEKTPPLPLRPAIIKPAVTTAYSQAYGEVPPAATKPDTTPRSVSVEPLITTHTQPETAEIIPLHPSAEWFKQLQTMSSFIAGEYEGKETPGLVLGPDAAGKPTVRICTIDNQSVPYQLYIDQRGGIRMRKISPNAPSMEIISAANGWTGEIKADAGFSINAKSYFKIGEVVFRLVGNQLVPLSTAEKQAIEQFVREQRVSEAADPRARTPVPQDDGLPSPPTTRLI